MINPRPVVKLTHEANSIIIISIHPRHRSWMTSLKRSHQNMPTYQFLLHTTGISLDLGDGEAPAIGFYTSRRAKASNSEEAYKIVMAEMDSDADLEDVFRSGYDAGLRPQTISEEAYVIPWWRAILPWRKPGMTLYADEPDEPDDDGNGTAK